MRKFFTMLFVSCITLAAQAVPSLWTGTASTAWNNTSNWSTGVVPTPSSSFTIPAGCSHYPVVTGSASIGTITIASGASVTVSSGSTLNVYGDIINAGAASFGAGTVSLHGTNNNITGGNCTFGTLNLTGGASYSAYNTITISTVLSLSNGSTLNTSGCINFVMLSGAYILDDGSGNDITGTVTIQRYVSGSTGYHHICSPVACTLSGLGGFSIYGADGAQSITQTPESSLQAYDEQDNPGSTLNTGYYDYVSPAESANYSTYNLATGGLGMTALLTHGSTISFTGTVALGSSYGFLATTNAYNPAVRGWNFIGNPYPFPLAWNLFATNNPHIIGNAAYSWVPSGVNTGSWHTISGNVPVAIGQGFFVHMSSQTALNFNSTWGFASNPTFYQSIRHDEINLSLTSATESAEALTYTVSGNASEMDAVLPPTMGENMNATSIAFASEGQNYLTKVTNSIDENTVKPIAIHTTTPGTYTISATTNVDGPVYLYDKGANKYYDLSTESASFSSAGNEDNNNYSIVFKKATAGAPSSDVNIWGTEGAVNITRVLNTPATITVTDLLGQQIISTSSASGSITLPISVSGLYMVTEKEANGTETVRKVYVK